MHFWTKQRGAGRHHPLNPHLWLPRHQTMRMHLLNSTTTEPSGREEGLRHRHSMNGDSCNSEEQVLLFLGLNVLRKYSVVWWSVPMRARICEEAPVDRAWSSFQGSQSRPSRVLGRARSSIFRTTINLSRTGRPVLCWFVYFTFHLSVEYSGASCLPKIVETDPWATLSVHSM